ncbi:MAG: hypothetical protein ACOYT8_03575 [Candidatus Dependentiae bacterium]
MNKILLLVAMSASCCFTMEQQSVKKTRLSTEVDDRAAINTFDSIFTKDSEYFDNVIPKELKTEYLGQIITKLDDYFANNANTPTTVETLQRSEESLKLLRQEQKEIAPTPQLLHHTAEKKEVMETIVRIYNEKYKSYGPQLTSEQLENIYKGKH